MENEKNKDLNEVRREVREKWTNKDKEIPENNIGVETVGGLKREVTWNLTLSTGLKLEIVDWVPEEGVGMVPYSEPTLVITPPGQSETLEVAGLDIDAFLLVIRQLRSDRPDPFGDVHPAVRRKALKAFKSYENKERPKKY